ncbi:hypothetical protein A0H81_14828 [Grifola frondosa]|uniref:Uncharacterized protein n=1 Tax=Grifola frondosa TaxID=5627 RepID=A0A1C7LKX6_GRIFR|nr:hypothetical protein A0H81_14828 [Grifola frondosa]
MAVIMDNYANQLAEQYGNDVASEVMARSRSNLQLDAMPTMPMICSAVGYFLASGRECSVLYLFLGHLDTASNSTPFCLAVLNAGLMELCVLYTRASWDTFAIRIILIAPHLSPHRSYIQI